MTTFRVEERTCFVCVEVSEHKVLQSTSAFGSQPVLSDPQIWIPDHLYPSDIASICGSRGVRPVVIVLQTSLKGVQRHPR